MMRGTCSGGDHLMLCRLQMTEAALALSEQKNHNMGELLTQVKVEKEEQLERWSREKKKELEARAHTSCQAVIISMQMAGVAGFHWRFHPLDSFIN